MRGEWDHRRWRQFSSGSHLGRQRWLSLRTQGNLSHHLCRIAQSINDLRRNNARIRRRCLAQGDVGGTALHQNFQRRVLCHADQSPDRLQLSAWTQRLGDRRQQPGNLREACPRDRWADQGMPNQPEHDRLEQRRRPRHSYRIFRRERVDIWSSRRGLRLRSRRSRINGRGSRYRRRARHLFRWTRLRRSSSKFVDR